MAKPERRASAMPPRLPGEPAPPAVVEESRAESLAVIREEYDEQRAVIDRATERAALENAAAGVQTVLPKDVTPEMRYASHTATVDLIAEELKQQDAQNEPRQPIRSGLDEASLELIKAEFKKNHKRIVLPGG